MPHTDAVHAFALAKAEVLIAFAHRWAAIARLPAHLRNAAAAALKAEQAATLHTRSRELMIRARQGHRCRLAALKSASVQPQEKSPAPIPPGRSQHMAKMPGKPLP